jgi:hypothetical protein
MGIRKFLIAACAFVVVALGAGAAKADYVCYVRYFPVSATAGSEGYVNFTVYEGVGCTGTYVGSYNLCSTGATASSCVASTSYHYERLGLLANFESLQRAAAANQSVATSATMACNGGALACIGYVYYFPDFN